MLDFLEIDAAIKKFRKGKYGIFITLKSRPDWFSSEYRSIEWKKDYLDFIIEIFPDIDENGISVSWNYSAMIHFDENHNRHLAKYRFAKSLPFNMVESIFIETLEEKYNYLNALKDTEIQFTITPLSQNF